MVLQNFKKLGGCVWVEANVYVNNTQYAHTPRVYFCQCPDNAHVCMQICTQFTVRYIIDGTVKNFLPGPKSHTYMHQGCLGIEHRE